MPAENRRVEAALAALDAAHDALALTLEEEFPVGAAVEWTEKRYLPRSLEYRAYDYKGRVVAHSRYGYPGHVRCQNLATGKVREVDAQNLRLAEAKGPEEEPHAV